MYSVSILIPMNDNYFSNRLSLETNIDRTGVANCQVLVYNNGADTKIKEWCLNELKDKITYLESEFIKPNSDVLNLMLEEVDRKYIVIIPEPVILPNNWLFELVKQTDSVFNSGMVAISTDNDKGNLTSKLNQFDENVFVWQQENNLVYGVTCFDARLLDVIGGFNNKIHSGYEYLDYSYRLSILGFWNYYVSGVYATAIKEYEPMGETTTIDEFILNCKEVHSKKKLQILFRPESENLKLAYSNIEDLMVKFASNNKQTFFHKIRNLIEVDLNFIKSDEVGYIKQFSNQYGLNYFMKPSRDIKGVAINFYANGKQSLYKTD